MGSYWRASSSPAYNFFLSLALLVGYEGILYLTGNPSSERNLVDLWLTRLLGWAKPYEWIISLGIVLLGLAYVYGLRRDKTRLTEWFFALMLLEAAGWAWLLYVALPFLTSHWLRPPAAQLNFLSPSFWEGVGLCMGAGFYEELFFRVLLVSALVGLFTGLRPRKATAMHLVAAWILSAVLFSAAHFLYEPATAYAFLYRAFFGLFMSGVYILRGFGIAAWTHALYDIAVLWWH